jgi:diadenosine tetraphosphate (Ap4A) HIT family hydrolase
MTQWADPAHWARQCRGEACVIGRQGAPNDVVADLDSTWVTLNEDAAMRGYACLVFRRHAVELHDLSDAEGAAFMRDAQRLSAAVHRVTGAVKLNYEVHGNTIVQRPVYAPGEFTELRARLRTALRGR